MRGSQGGGRYILPLGPKRLREEMQNGGRALGKEASSQVSSGRDLRAPQEQRWGPGQEGNPELKGKTGRNSRAVYFR